MIGTDTILKSDFNSAIQDAITALKPLLLDAEAKAATAGDQPTIDALSALHTELSNQLAIADDLGATGGIHTDTGGGNKAQES